MRIVEREMGAGTARSLPDSISKLLNRGASFFAVARGESEVMRIVEREMGAGTARSLPDSI